MDKYEVEKLDLLLNKWMVEKWDILIIDEKEVYHFGASLKDLGKKWFAFSKMDVQALEMIANLKHGGGDEWVGEWENGRMSNVWRNFS